MNSREIADKGDLSLPLHCSLVLASQKVMGKCIVLSYNVNDLVSNLHVVSAYVTIISEIRVWILEVYRSVINH